MSKAILRFEQVETWCVNGYCPECGVYINRNMAPFLDRSKPMRCIECNHYIDSHDEIFSIKFMRDEEEAKRYAVKHLDPDMVELKMGTYGGKMEL